MKLPAIKGFNEEAFNKYLKNTGLLMLGRVGSLAIKMFVSINAGLGLDQFIVKELHQNPTNRDKILGTAFLLKVMAGLACIPTIFIAWQIYPLSDISYQIIFILSFTGLFQSLTVVDAYFQSEVKSKYIMQVQIIGNLISAAVKFTLILTNSPLLYFVISYIFDIFLLSIGYFGIYQRKGRSIFNWGFDGKLAKKLLHYSWPLIISGIMVSVYM
ncbi:MAG: flippase, partial [Pedobacter sp.]